MTGRTGRRMSPQARRAHLVDTALELYQRRPPEDVAVEDVTGAADVSRALFYRYFPNVAALRVAALGTVVDELVSRVALPADGSPAEQLAVALGEFLDVARRHGRAYVALLRSGSVISTGETDALVDGVRDHIVALLVERGGMPEPDAWQLMTLRGWVALVEGSTLTWLRDEGTGIGRDELRDWLVAQLSALTQVTARRDPTVVVDTRR